MDVALAQIRLVALHGVTLGPVQHACPPPPQGFVAVAETVNIVVLPVTETMTVALRAPTADAMKLSESVQLAPALPVPVSAEPHPLTINSLVLPLLIAGTEVATSPPLLIETDPGFATLTVTGPRSRVAGFADNPAGC